MQARPAAGQERAWAAPGEEADRRGRAPACRSRAGQGRPARPGARAGSAVKQNRGMTKPVIQARTLVTEDGVPIDVVHLPGDSDLAIVLAHGFTQNWQRPWVWRAATQLNGVAGSSPSISAGMAAQAGRRRSATGVSDVEVAVAYARDSGTAGGHGRLLDGGLDRAPARGPDRRRRCRRLDERPWPVVLPRHQSMRRVHWAVEHKAGRLATRTPEHPNQPGSLGSGAAAASRSGCPDLACAAADRAGDQDVFFPPDHAEELFAAAREPKELWTVPGFAHAATATRPALLDRIACGSPPGPRSPPAPTPWPEPGRVPPASGAGASGRAWRGGSGRSARRWRHRRY